MIKIPGIPTEECEALEKLSKELEIWDMACGCNYCQQHTWRDDYPGGDEDMLWHEKGCPLYGDTLVFLYWQLSGWCNEEHIMKAGLYLFNGHNPSCISRMVFSGDGCSCDHPLVHTSRKASDYNTQIEFPFKE